MEASLSGVVGLILADKEQSRGKLRFYRYDISEGTAVL